MTNRRIKFLDVSYNFVDINVIHAFRLMIERNTSLKYLGISDLYKFNDRAVDSIIISLQQNQMLRMLDLKTVTQGFFHKIEMANQTRKDSDKIEFRRDPKFLKRKVEDNWENFEPLRA